MKIENITDTPSLIEELKEAEATYGAGIHRIAIIPKGSATHNLLRRIWRWNTDNGHTAVTYPRNIAVMEVRGLLIEIAPEAGSGKYIKVLSLTHQ